LVAIKSVSRFGWGSSCITVLAIPILVGAVACCVSVGILSTLGPEVGNIFSQILTPVP
jgi:type II secretory pathway component PulF